MFRSILVGLVALALTATFGCYTMIRHPATETDLDQTQDPTCADCHANSDAYHWTDPYYTSFYGFYSSPWQSYYAQPWWHEDWWGSSPMPPDGSAPVTGQRTAWDRGPGAPSQNPLGGSAYTPTGGSPAAASQDTSRAAKPTPAKERKKAEPKRNAWKR
jgi:hypothetical protein